MGMPFTQGWAFPVEASLLRSDVSAIFADKSTALARKNRPTSVQG
jgi:hypothetical protein